MPVIGSVFGKPLDDDVYGIQNALAIIVSGDTAPSALSQGKYIYLINHSTIRSGLYKIISAIASGDTIVSTDIEAVTDGIINGLVEADGTKVNKTDIVDNLTTNDSTKVLSAAQGYALNSKIVVVNKNVTLGESFNSGQIKECILDISDLKQTYSEVYLMNFAGVSGANYNSFQFCYGYSLSNNNYSVGIRNNNTSAQTASSFDVQFLCIK